MHIRLSTAVSVLLLFAVIQGGQFTNSDFTSSSLSNQVVSTSSNVFVDTYDTLFLHILKDGQITNRTPDSSYSPDVVSMEGDSFCYFWVENSGADQRAYRKEYRLNINGYDSSSIIAASGISTTPMASLNAERGTADGNYLVSDKVDSLTLWYRGSSRNAVFGVYNHSITHVANDTFAFVYKRDNNILAMRLYRASGLTLSSTDGGVATPIRLKTDGPGTNISNNDVAADSSGNIMVAATRGGFGQTQVLEYILTNTNFDLNDAGTINTGISLNTSNIFGYKDAQIVSYADGKFAVVYWKSTNVYLANLEVTGAPASVTTLTNTVVASGSTYRSPTISSNGKYIFVAWKNITSGTIEGKRIPVSAGVIGSVPATVTTFSAPATSVNDDNDELNSAITSSSSIALAWKQGQHSIGSVWSDKGVRYTTGEWISPVETVTMITGDSIIFLPGDIDTALYGGAASAYFRKGPTNSVNGDWTSWLPLGDSAQLAANTLDTCKYFQYRFLISRNNIDTIRTAYVNGVTLNWNVKPRIMSYDSLMVNGIKDGSVSLFTDTADIISHSDTAILHIGIYDADSDEVNVLTNWPVSPTLASDTVSGSVNMQAVIRLNPTTVWDTVYTVTFNGADENSWSMIGEQTVFRVRKETPVINDVIFNGDTITDGNQANITVGINHKVTVFPERSQIVSWNPLTYRFRTDIKDTSFTVYSGSSDDSLIFIADSSDLYMVVYVTDAYGAVDSSRINFIYPEYNVDTVSNPGYYPAYYALGDSLSYFLNYDSADTVILPLFNSGNDTLSIDSITFSGHSPSWLSLGVPQDTGTVYFNQLGGGTNITPVLMLPDSFSYLTFIIDPSGFTGDSILYDTILVWENDPVYPVDTIPVKIEYNDAPHIDSISFSFDKTTPYWRSVRAVSDYIFPPHARIKIDFSESMDSASAEGMLRAYSVFDSTAEGTIDTIDFVNSWNSDYTELYLAPLYRDSSYHFNFFPDTGYFIPTDSLRFYIHSEITDDATTTIGPNKLDLTWSFLPDSGLDTLYEMRVDSIKFTIDSVSPSNMDSAILSTSPIVLYFSDIIYPGTVDTSKFNNRTLVVTSAHNSTIDSSRQIIFDTVFVIDRRAVFVPKKQFFYGDSVRCQYRSVSLRDSLGYPIDMNGDGISDALFDSSSQRDDYFWYFRTADIKLDSVTPDSASHGIDMNAPITLHFSDVLINGLIDTSIVDNKSLTILSLYSEDSLIQYDSVRVVGNRAIFYLERRLFYSDSVTCFFNGLLSSDTLNYSIDLGGDTLFVSGNSYLWHYFVEDLRLTSVSPDSGSNDADVKAPIELQFSGPISTRIIDTTTDADSNRSFFFITSYSGGNRMPIHSIYISSDSTRVSIEPEDAFFSNDSIHCNFLGFKSGWSYNDTTSTIIGNVGETGLLQSYDWFFLTGRTKFYTFPNPYKPGSNQRHAAQGGIMFKNLHSLKKGNSIVTIKVFSINANPIFISDPIFFEEGSSVDKPEWLWDVKNNKGNPLASGVYLYIIYDKDGEALLKGKLMIVR